MIRQTLNYLSSRKWNSDLVKQFNKIMLKYPLNINEEKIPDGNYQLINLWKLSLSYLEFNILTGVTYHVSDIYLEELAKQGNTLKPLKAVTMLQVFVKSMAVSKK